MEITKELKFTTRCYGGKSFLPEDKVVLNWLKAQQDRLLHSRFKALKDAIGNDEKLGELLSVFNTDEEDRPIIGDWMLLECSINAQKMAGTWSKFQVSADKWVSSVNFTPMKCNFYNGKIIEGPDGVEVYGCKPRDRKTPFFTAYQYLNAGAKMKMTINFPDDLCEKPADKKDDKDGKKDGKDVISNPDPEMSEACVNTVLDKMQRVGLGAFRRRFGKFEWVS